MSSVKIDYSKLLVSAPEIETTSQTVKIAIEELSEIRETIEFLGKNHNHCFGNVSSEVEKELNNIIQKMIKLSNDMMVTINTFTQAELAMIKEMNIKSKGIDDALKWRHSNTYQESLAGYDYEYYQKLLTHSLSMANGQRAKSTMAAIFLATSFPHMNYFWGGGHDKISIGLNPAWGQMKKVTAIGSDTTGTYQPNSLDCSGYISWALKNGGYDISKPMVTGELEKIGEKVAITEANKNNIQVGDLAYMDGHVGMIIKKDADEITVSHCSSSGNGMNITKIDINTGLVTADYTNSKVEKERIGKPFFTDIIKVNYQD